MASTSSTSARRTRRAGACASSPASARECRSATGGGRLIWQLQDSQDLLVAWHEITWDETAYERRLLARVVELTGGRRPYANLTG